MAEHQYEIEIKSLLGSRENKDRLLGRMRAMDPGMTLRGTEKQLNHYFIAGSGERIFEKISPLIRAERLEAFRKILAEGKNLSVRTRQANERVLFVIKASIDDTTSSNGTARIEFEAEVDLSLDALDALLLEAGCTYQAKWSRDREEYQLGDTVVCIDRNAGYGYLAEFERVITSSEEAESVKADLRGLMESLEATELAQDRLERMFAHYNEHWPEYYGTEKIFTIE